MPIGTTIGSVFPLFPTKPAGSSTQVRDDPSNLGDNSSLRSLLYQDGNIVNPIITRTVLVIATNGVPPPDATPCPPVAPGPPNLEDMTRRRFDMYQPQQDRQDPTSITAGTMETKDGTTVRLFRPQLTTFEQEMQDLL